MQLIADVTNRLFDLLLAPFGGSAAWAMTGVSVLAGAALLLLFKAVTPQERLAATRDRLVGHLYELGLYQDDLGVMLRIQRDLARANLRYLALTLPALAVFVPPLVLILAQLDARFAHRPPRPGEALLVTAVVAPGGEALLDSLRLAVPAGVLLETPPVRDRAARSATWRVRPAAAGEFELAVQTPGGVWTKRLAAGGGLPRLAAVRERAGWRAALLNPAEPPLPGDAPLAAISLALPARQTSYAGVRLPWLAAFCIISLAAGLALKGPLRVRL